MNQFKLVVVSPFENYKRGDEILNQDIVGKILDVNDEMHHYEKFTRRVLLSNNEMIHLQSVKAPLLVVNEEHLAPQVQPDPEPNHSTENINPEPNDAA